MYGLLDLKPNYSTLKVRVLRPISQQESFCTLQLDLVLVFCRFFDVASYVARTIKKRH